MLHLRKLKLIRYRANSNLKCLSSQTNGNNSKNDTRQNEEKNPIIRTLQALKNDIHELKKRITNENQPANSKTHGHNQFQTHCDVLVIGGGGVGSSIAYWLKQKARNGLNVVVAEKDPSYSKASTVLSVGGLRQQFSLPENIQMSLYAADFLRESKENLGDVDINFTPYGYLILASEEGAEILRRNSQLQNELGARNELLSRERLRVKFPWLNTDNIALGCHGLEKEGWFDPWALLMGFKSKAIEYGAHYVNGEVIGFERTCQEDVFIDGYPTSSDYMALDKAIIKMKDGSIKTVKFAICVLAAGALSGEVAKLASIGVGEGLLRIPLPVEPRKRFVYVFTTQGLEAPGLGSPLLIDPNGTYFRRDGLGGNYICGRSPSPDKEHSIDNLDVDHDYFTTDVWPTLAHRVPAFESAKVVGSWAGFYEYNLFDENGIIGPHPYYNNLYIATGFSGHGIQQTPAVGRAISELIIDGQFRTIDLTRLGFDRVIVDEPLFELNIV